MSKEISPCDKCNDYNKKEKYRRISLEVTHEKYAEIKEQSERTGESVNGFIKKAIDDRLNNDK